MNALDYGGRDWRDHLAVFPVEPEGKRPMVKWRQESTIWDEWAGRWPKDAGFGIDCGRSGLVVIDEDVPGAVEQWLGYIPQTHTVRTARGRHFYFLAPSGVRVRNGVRVAPGVDVRAEGGYVVGAGSRHSSGVTYTAENTWRPAELPDDVLRRLTEPAAEPAPGPKPASVLPEVIEEHTRGEVLFKYACSLESRGLDDDEALVLLRDAWARCDPPYTKRTPEAMWAHVVEEYREPSGLLDVEGVLVHRQEFEQMKSRRLLWRLADRAALDEIEDAEIAATVDQWVDGSAVLDVDAVSPILGTDDAPLTAHGQSTMVFGVDGTGKSTLAEHYVKARLVLPGWTDGMVGEPVVPLPKDQRVLYLAADRPAQIMEGFQRGTDESMREVLADRLKIHAGPPPHDLTTRAGRRWLLAEVERTNAGLLVLDAYKDMVDPMDPAAVSALNRLLKQLDAAGVEVMALHHNVQTTDAPSKRPALNDVYGHRNVYSGFGSVIEIKGTPGADLVAAHQVKPIREKHAPIWIAVGKADGRCTVHVESRKSTDQPDASDAPPTVDLERVRLRALFEAHAESDGWVPAKSLNDELSRLDRAFAGYWHDPKTNPSGPIEHNGARGPQSRYRWVENRPKGVVLE